MKRQPSDDSIQTIVYSYGTVPSRVAPVRNEEAALAQLRLANRLWNMLVEIDQARVARYAEIMRDERSDRIAALTEEINGLRDEIQAKRKEARKLRVPVGDAPERIKALIEERKRLFEEARASSAARHEERREQLDALALDGAERIKRARQQAAAEGLFWGTYNDVVQRADAGRKLGKLKFHRFAGTGTLTAQIMGGAIVSRCAPGGHQFFQVDPETPGQRWRYARIRISSVERAPVWLEIPIVLHRDMPPAGMIKSVSATRRVVAGQVRWQLNVTLNQPAPALKTEGGVIAIDIGWRQLDHGGVRVAYWTDDAGGRGEVVVPERDLEAVAQSATLRSHVDRDRDEFLPALVEWLAGQELPEEWQERSAHIAQWRSPERVAALVRWWAAARLPGDEEIYRAACAWRSRFLHLNHWRRNHEEQIRARIRERYRIFAKQTAERYGRVVIEDFNLRRVAMLPAPEQKEDERPEAHGSRSSRQSVSPSEFRGALVNACRRLGTSVVKLPARNTTRKCHLCGYEKAWDAAEAILHACAGCGRTWDQDYNAAVNLLLEDASGPAVIEAEPIEPNDFEGENTGSEGGSRKATAR